MWLFHFSQWSAPAQPANADLPLPPSPALERRSAIMQPSKLRWQPNSILSAAPSSTDTSPRRRRSPPGAVPLSQAELPRRALGLGRMWILGNVWVNRMQRGRRHRPAHTVADNACFVAPSRRPCVHGACSTAPRHPCSAHKHTASTSQGTRTSQGLRPGHCSAWRRCGQPTEPVSPWAAS